MTPDLYNACSEPSVHELLRTKISKERIAIELKHMLSHPSYEKAVNLLYSTQLLRQIIRIPSSTINKTDNASCSHFEIVCRGVASLQLFSKLQVSHPQLAKAINHLHEEQEMSKDHRFVPFHYLSSK